MGKRLAYSEYGEVLQRLLDAPEVVDEVHDEWEEGDGLGSSDEEDNDEVGIYSKHSAGKVFGETEKIMIHRSMRQNKWDIKGKEDAALVANRLLVQTNW